jgi:N-acetylgalactosamine kinase
VIANSLTVSNKAETAARYNLRVVECRLAAVMLALRSVSQLEEARTKKKTLKCAL